MYSVRVKSSPSLSLEGLAPLVTHEGKNVPTNKELRVSDGWKVKDEPGTGSSFGRGPHRKAAVDGLENLWLKCLRDRKCSEAGSGIWRVVVPNDARYVTVGNLRSLLAVSGTIDALVAGHGLTPSVVTKLVAHAISQVGVSEIPTQKARLEAAAALLVASPSKTVQEAYREAGQARAHWVIQSSPAEADKAKPTPQKPAPQVQQPVASPPKVIEEPSASKPGVRTESKRKPTTDEAHASMHVRSILAGAAPIGVAATVTAKEKPFLIAKLVSAIEDLGVQSADPEVYRTKLLRVAKFFDMWQLQKSTPQRPTFTVEDRVALPEWLTHAMNKLTELDANKLPQTR